MIKDYWDSYHKLELKYDYYIPPEIDNLFLEHVTKYFYEFALGLEEIENHYWKLNIYFDKNQHEYRLKVIFKNQSKCSYFLDGNEVKTTKTCNVPKQIDRFCRLVVSQCWNKVVSYIKHKKDVYKLLHKYVIQYAYTKRIEC